MTVLYNSGFVHRDHHRLRDQLRDLRRNTCWTAALFRRLRVYTRRHAFHFSTIETIVAAPMATFSAAFAPITTKVGVGTQKGTLIAVRRLVTAALFRRSLWETTAGHTLPCHTSAVHIGYGSWALYKANHICGLD